MGDEPQVSSEDGNQLELDTCKKLSPEMQMWCSVLQLAIADAEPWIKGWSSKTYEQRFYGKFAMMWIMSESTRLGGFRWICEMLELDRFKVREMIGLGENDGIW